MLTTNTYLSSPFRRLWPVFLGLFILTRFPVLAQDYDRYEPLRCMGPIPEELRTPPSKKYHDDLAALGDSAKSESGKARGEFLLQSNFVLDEMLLSGRVLFGDPVTNYLTKVKDKLLQHDPELQKQIRIYTVKSPAVNAFATNSGVLLVNLGLVAHCKSEAQLAFVLAHEIQHFVHKHPINNYVNAENLRSNAKNLGINSYEDYAMAKTRYSRERELEADAFGFELYKRSGYSLAAAADVFELLDYADHPFDNMPWDPSVFEHEFMRFPPEFRKWPLDSIKFEEKEDNGSQVLMSTHPSIEKRRSVIDSLLKTMNMEEGDVFLVGAPEFLEVRKLARFELCGLFLSLHAYEYAIYNCYLLQADEPDSRYLRKIAAQAMYALSTYKNARNFGEVHVDPDDVGGEFQQIPYFMESGNRTFYSILAVHETWEEFLKDTTDKDLRAVAYATLKDLLFRHRSTAEWLAHDRPETMPRVLDSLMQAQQLAIQRRSMPEVADSLEEEEADEVQSLHENANYFMEWSLTDLFQNDYFADVWAKAMESPRSVDGEGEDDEPANGMQSMTKRERIKGLSLGIDSVVVVQPIFKVGDTRRGFELNYLASADGLVEYKSIFSEMADRTDLHHKFLENRDLAEGDVETFNDVATVLQWFSDYEHGSDERVHLVNFRHADTEALVQRYGMKHFMVTGLVQMREGPTYGQRIGMIMGITVFPLFPITLIHYAKPHYRSLFVTLLYDLEDSHAVWESYQTVSHKASSSFMRSHIYNHLLQITSEQ